MKKNSRILCIVAAVCAVLMLAASLGTLSPGLAAKQAIITAEAVTAVPGGIIEYRVSIAENPGIVSYNLRLTFDTAVFSPVVDEDGEIICTQGDFTTKGTLICAPTDDGCQVLWTHTADITASGTLFVLHLRVSEDAPLGTYPIGIENVSKNTVNKNEELVPLSCNGSDVTVRRFEPTVYGEAVTARQGRTIEYTVSLRDNPGIASYDIQVLFDAAVLTPLDPALTEPAGFASGDIVYKTYSNAIEVFWHAATDTTETGELFTLHFTVNDDAPLGTHPITVLCVEDNTQNTTEETVGFLCENGEITVLSIVDVSIEFVGTNTVTVHIAGAEDRYVIAAVYNADGKMIALELKRNVAEDTFDLAVPEGLSGCMCKVMILDGNFAPICPAFTAE